jgi:hypothetical protein
VTPPTIHARPAVRAQIASRVAGRMNRTELRYASEWLEPRRLLGEILRWDFEPVKLRLADSTYLAPDFRVILAEGTEEYHEVKGGFIREDAWIKLKIAAELHPYVFRMAQLRNGAWTVTTL